MELQSVNPPVSKFCRSPFQNYYFRTVVH